MLIIMRYMTITFIIYFLMCFQYKYRLRVIKNYVSQGTLKGIISRLILRPTDSFTEHNRLDSCSDILHTKTKSFLQEKEIENDKLQKT